MKFDDKISEEEYTKFWEENINAHFLNAYWWGICNQNKRKQTPLYVGLKDENGKLLAATLLLKRTTPFNMCYFYAPRGYLIDWKNQKIVKDFTEALREFLKAQNAIYLKVDPGISYQDVDNEANKVPDGNNNYALFNYLQTLCYIHQGFNKLYEKNQPRYTFRTIFKNYHNIAEIDQSISKTFMRTIKRSYNYDLDITVNNNVDDFYDLATKVAQKDNFQSYSKKYYADIMKYYGEHGYIKNFVAKINPQNLITKFSNELATEKNPDRITKLNKDIDYLKQIPQNKHIIASLICIYTKKGAWSLYIGNDDTAEYTGTVNRLYYEFIKDAYLNHKDFADLFGVCGDPHTKYKNLAGIFTYKQKLGGTCLEFMGEFDLVNKPFWYKVLPSLLKIYRSLKK
jgi:lipid II:glycine glycyltransferase (peptidoglycan interpeptide bridge formation enzyme)